MSSSPINNQDAQQEWPATAIRGFYGGFWEIFGRTVRIIFPILIVVFLIVALVFTNASNVKELNNSIDNCSNPNFHSSIDIDRLRLSVNIFSGVYLAVAFFAIVIKSAIFTLKLTSPTMAKNSRKTFIYIETIMYHCLTHAYIGGVVGSFYMANSVNQYARIFRSELNNNELSNFGVISGMMWGSFSIFISAYINEFFGTHEMAYARHCISKGNTRCGQSGRNGVELEKKSDF